MFVILLWIKEAIVGLGRNIWWNAVAITLSFICLLFFSIAYISGNTAEQFSKQINQKLEIQLDIADENTNYSEIQEQLRKDERISDITFISKEEAQKKMIKEMGKDADILKIFNGENIFPAQFIVKVKNPNDIEKVANDLNKNTSFTKVLYGKEYVDKLLQITEKVKSIGYYVTVIGAVFVVLLIFWIIRMNIEQRKEEIAIKKLIGAGSLTIKMPFLIESMSIMGISSLITYFVFVKGYNEFLTRINDGLPFSANSFFSIGEVQQLISLPLFGVAFIIGLIASILATTKHLR